MTQQKIAILIHGYHLESEEWENIVWGDPQNGKLGRAPRGIQLAVREKADLIFWGGGASEKDNKKESQHIFEYAVKHGSQLPEFAGMDNQEIERKLKDISHIDIEAQDTRQEVGNAEVLCHERGITRIILVSSPTHISRCLLEAEKLRTEGKFHGVEVFATSSDTCYAHTTPSDVFIIEPPHRGDRPKVFLNLTLKGISQIRKNFFLAPGFNDALAKLIDEWRGKL